MSTFSRRLREFAAAEIAKPGTHTRAELAQRFLDEHADLARTFIRGLAERRVADLIRDLCDEPTTEWQPDLFGGFPAAVVVEPGLVKATANCDLADLAAGEKNREENIRAASHKLRRYRASMASFEALRERDDETVGEVTARLRARQNPQHAAAQQLVDERVAAGELIRLTGGRLIEADRFDPAVHERVEPA